MLALRQWDELHAIDGLHTAQSKKAKQHSVDTVPFKRQVNAVL